ncbi:NUDIX hydrolase [Mesorhizobium sp. BAC0120]|uniref:NUDIX hydrolase n=1 Tax=Mesorhizobium sp. BAC0120 TaxID=3090670 RepID=UPI00298D443A|nr:NUDIX hydrolase [Mesorhizobium sp. BAC0120]MDW6022781.1 NUDIX hydrolase [Mesorhizobium sp. BAC0120]
MQANLTKSDIDKAEGRDFALGEGPKRPRDAATLILIDRSGSGFKVLLGRRHARHAFMPGKFVFPGGRTDPADSRIVPAGDLHPLELAKLTARNRVRPGRARSIALSAVRETYEEAGLLIGRKGAFSAKSEDWRGFADHAVQPSLENLRFVARAITPPGRVRRFDTRFFAAWREDIAIALPAGPTDELEEIVWLPLDEAKRADIPTITKMILESLEERLSTDPDLAPGGTVPFYRLVGKRFVRELL